MKLFSTWEPILRSLCVYIMLAHGVIGEKVVFASPPFLAQFYRNQLKRRLTGNGYPSGITHDEYIVTSDPTLLCPEGYAEYYDAEKRYTKCKKQFFKTSELGCPDGWTYSDSGECKGTDTAEPEFVCLDGFKKAGNLCIRDDIAPRQAQCSSGFMMSEGSRCMRRRSVPALPTCTLPGYSLTSDETRCILPESLDPLFSCPQGFYKQSELPETPSLPPEFCLRYEKQTPRRACPPGLLMLNDVECAGSKTIPVAFECPENFTLRHRSCERIVAQPATLQCPPGTTHLQNHCQAPDNEKLQQLCSKKYRVLATCPHTNNFIKPQYLCPNGYKLFHNQCRRENHPVIAPQHRCPQDYRLTYKKNTIGCICSASIRSEANVSELLDSAPGKTSVWPEGTNADCDSRPDIKPVPVCPEGMLLTRNNTLCEFRKVMPPVPVCPDAFEYSLEHEHCIKHYLLPIVSECDDGYMLAEKGTSCVKVLKHPITINCPEDYILQQGHPPFCSGYATMLPKYYCPPAFTLIEKNNRSQSHTFPRNITNVNDALPTCEMREEQPAKLRCPDAYHESLGGQCVRQRTHTPLPVCPAGFQLVFQQCIRTVQRPAVIMCPVGYDYQPTATLPVHDVATFPQGVCIKRIIAEKIPVCAGGYIYDASLDLCYKRVVEHRNIDIAVASQPYSRNYNDHPHPSNHHTPHNTMTQQPHHSASASKTTTQQPAQNRKKQNAKNSKFPAATPETPASPSNNLPMYTSTVLKQNGGQQQPDEYRNYFFPSSTIPELPSSLPSQRTAVDLPNTSVKNIFGDDPGPTTGNSPEGTQPFTETEVEPEYVDNTRQKSAPESRNTGDGRTRRERRKQTLAMGKLPTTAQHERITPIRHG